MKNKEYKNFDKISKTKYSAAIFRQKHFILYPHVKRNIPRQIWRICDE